MLRHELLHLSLLLLALSQRYQLFESAHNLSKGGWFFWFVLRGNGGMYCSRLLLPELDIGVFVDGKVIRLFVLQLNIVTAPVLLLQVDSESSSCRTTLAEE